MPDLPAGVSEEYSNICGELWVFVRHAVGRGCLRTEEQVQYSEIYYIRRNLGRWCTDRSSTTVSDPKTREECCP